MIESAILPMDKINKLFCRIDVLYSNHQKFLISLKERIKNWNSEQKIGDLFIKEVNIIIKKFFLFS